MRSLHPVRGTQDLLPEAARRHRQVSETARAMAELYGFVEMATPIFEFTEVFARPIGEHTDIVAKEMYTFTDRGGEEVTLRPENTAGVVRAVLSNGLVQSLPLKFFWLRPGWSNFTPTRILPALTMSATRISFDDCAAASAGISSGAIAMSTRRLRVTASSLSCP